MAFPFPGTLPVPQQQAGGAPAAAGPEAAAARLRLG